MRQGVVSSPGRQRGDEPAGELDESIVERNEGVYVEILLNVMPPPQRYAATGQTWRCVFCRFTGLTRSTSGRADARLTIVEPPTP